MDHTTPGVVLNTLRLWKAGGLMVGLPPLSSENKVGGGLMYICQAGMLAILNQYFAR